METNKALRDLASADDYDPNSMPVAKAREFISKFLVPVTTIERLPIRSALGRIAAADVISPLNVPAHDNSAMDGYAVRFADLNIEHDVTLSVAGTAFAGKPFAGTAPTGSAIRIFTGAVVPQGFDTIIMQERAKVQDGKVTLGAGAKSGQNVRLAGADLNAGQAAVRKGQCIRPAHLGLIASLGIGEVAVYRKLRVAFFSTGDELVSIGSPLGEGQIYDSNRYTIFGMLTRLGCEVSDMGVIRDTPEAVEAAFKAAASAADVVITSGGVSVGDADFVKQMLDRLGDVLFWKIAMKPGRPLAFGKIGDAHFFGLPGNPVAVMVTFYQFVREALLTLMGQTELPLVPTFQARLTTVLKKAPGRTEFQRGILTQNTSGQWEVKITGDQSSGILSSMTQANCYVILGDAQGSLEPGAMVDVQAFEGLV